MYTKEEASHIRQSFWKAFGQYMALHTSADGLKTNWINYKTGIRYLNFRMQADGRHAVIAIEMSHPDAGIRALMFDQFRAMQRLLTTALGEAWVWEQDVSDEHGKAINTIGMTLDEVSIFKQGDWPALISFFKPRILALDAFWSTARYGFDLFA